MRRTPECWHRTIRMGAVAFALAATACPSAIAEQGATTTADPGHRPRGPRLPWPSTNAVGKRSDGGWSVLACVALVLAACGGLAVASRRIGPRGAGGTMMQVVGRVGLSPKHSVYLLRIGRRVLVVGAGPQGPPALIAELDEVPEETSAPRNGAES